MTRLSSLVNAAERRLAAIFPGYFEGAKHDHYQDFGYPKTITFPMLHSMYCRNSIARAAVDSTVEKVWETHPQLLESDASKEETSLESEIRQRFRDLRFWQNIMDADTKSLVGAYSGVILRLADGKRFREPVDTVPGGLDGLVEIIPAWEGQLTVSTWDTDELSETYGQPTMFQFNESSIGNTNTQQPRQFEVHPDRVIIWSKDATVHNRSFLEPGYNDLMTLEKVIGAGGEGFWKNAKRDPIINVEPDFKVANMAKAMGVAEDELLELMNDQVDDWQKGFDKLLMLQGMKAETLSVTLPSPEHFISGPLQVFAASIRMPMKILVGTQTGERASTEDAKQWSKTCMSHRENRVVPNIMDVINRLEQFGILPDRDWNLDWDSLTDSSEDEKMGLASKMSEINSKMERSGEIVFTHDEIREVTGRDPLSDADKYREEDEPDEEDEAAALGLVPEEIEAAA